MNERRIQDGPIIVFDALCVLCTANAQFLLKYDKTGHFHLASMQGDVGAALFRKFDIDSADPETMIVVDRDAVLRNSDAVLAIYAGLGWPWRLAEIFKLIPRFLRDPVYRLIARNRYRWFGKRTECWVPRADQQDRML